MKVLNFQSPYRQGESPYDIFKDRMSAIAQIVQGIKGRILNKYNKGVLDTTIDQLNKALNKDQSSELINILNADPGEDIYPSGIEEIAGQFVDITNVMGKITQQSKTMGGRTSMMGTPPTPGTPSSEVMIPKGDKMQLLNAVMNMPEGQMDFQPILNYIKEHRPKMMGSFSPMEQWALNQAMGQIGDPRDKMIKDIQAADAVHKYFEAPPEEKITSEIDFFRKDPQGYSEMLKLKQQIIGEKKTAWETEAETLFKWYEEDTINLDEFKKGMGIYIAPEKMSGFDKKFALASKMGLNANEWKKFFGVYLGEEPEVSKVKYYKTSDECVANAPKIEGMMVDPTLDKTKGWYPNYVKETKKDPKDYLFTKKNIFGEMSNIGIIPTNLQEKLSFGEPLTDEEKTQIKNNHNLQKSLLDEKMLAQVEAILKQIGIDLEETTEITPEPTPEPDPVGFWENFINKFKGKDYTTMSKEELYSLAEKGDRKAYEEAKRRGLVK